jgi:hypothetical protein
MSQIAKNRPAFSVRVAVLVIIAVIMILGVLFLFYTLPQEDGGKKSIGGANQETPTVAITNLVESTEVNRHVQVKGVDITVTRAMIATKFSDDRKANGVYTVRVLAKTENKGRTIIGIQYHEIVRLVLPNGEAVSPKLVSVKPAEYPGSSQTGFFDFPITEKIPLANLTLRFENTTTVPLSNG